MNVYFHNGCTKKKQIQFLEDAVKFFEWCRLNLESHLEKLHVNDQKEFDSGIISKKVFDKLKFAWSSYLKNHISWKEHFAAVRTALPNQNEYDLWKNCPMGQLQNLPKRIQIAVARGDRERQKKIHDSFFANDGDARLVDYLQVWQSQRHAMHKLIMQVTGRKLNEKGHMDTEQYFLDLVATKGTAAIGSLRYYLGGVQPVSLKTKKEIIYDEKLGPNTVLLPTHNSLWSSEDRLNGFLKKLGRALSSEKKRGVELYKPDWLHGVDQTIRFIVEGWCQNIIVDGEHWPTLCFLTNQTLVKFLRLCNVKHSKLGRKDARTMRFTTST